MYLLAVLQYLRTVHCSTTNCWTRCATDAGLENDSRNCTCAWSGRHLLAHTELLNEYNLQPRNIPDMTVAQVIERMSDMHDPVVPPPWEPCV